MKNLQRQIDHAVDRRVEQMVQIRRHLHAHPELSGEERKTSLYLYQLLGDQGFNVSMGPDGRGIIADSKSCHAGSSGRIALRADLDALRINDSKHVEYRSQCPGIMHACGHDAHTALVFGALCALNDVNGQSPPDGIIPMRGVFQPAEETCTGAREMIEVGALEGVAAIIAVHVDPSRQVGRVGLRTGVLTANCDEMQITIVGRGGHAARPHEASDPIAAAAQLINSLYLFIPRATDSQDAVVVTVGQIIGGDNANVIPEEVTLRGTIRTLDRGVRERTFEHIRRLASGIGRTSDTRISVEFGLGSASVHNDAGLIELMRRASRDVVGDDHIDEIARPSMGAEDFSYFLQTTPGAMLRLGCASQRAGGSPLHSSTFDIDEEALRIGAKILARTALLWSHQQSSTSQPRKMSVADQADST